MMMPHPILYGGLALDRAHPVRREADLAELCRHAGARFALYWRGLQLIGGTPPSAVLAGPDRALPLIAEPGRDVVLLGMDAAGPILAADISALEAGEDGPDLGGRWVLLRSVGGQLPDQDAALLAYARGLLVWRSRTRFCSVCGAALSFEDCGHSARCMAEACGTQAFPRTDPAIIVLVSDGGDRILLGRQPVWAPGMYSCLAGFAEPGESLEETVAREVAEEVGIRIREARYVASQPWPFPSSLMVGFEAIADAVPPTPDAHEIEDARWFSRDDLTRFGEREAPGPDGLFLPSRDSISRFLIERWRRG